MRSPLCLLALTLTLFGCENAPAANAQDAAPDLAPVDVVAAPDASLDASVDATPDVAPDAVTSACTTGCVRDWSAGPDLPFGTHHAAVGVFTHASIPYLYVVGGEDDTRAPRNRVVRSPIAADGTLGPWESQGTSPAPVARAASMRSTHPSTRLPMLLIAGGETAPTYMSGAIRLTYAAEYTTAGAFMWGMIDARLPAASLDSAIVEAPANTYYLIGGRAPSEPVADVRALYDGVRWTTSAALPTARASHLAVTSHGTIFVLGGVDASNALVSDVLRATPTRTALTAWTIAGQWPTPRRDAAALLHGDVLYVLGGAGASGALSTLERVTLTADAMGAFEPAGELPMALSGASAVEHAGRVYVVGGERGDTALASVWVAALP